MRLCVVFTLQDVHPDQFRFLWSTPDLSLEIVFRLERDQETRRRRSGKSLSFALTNPLLYTVKHCGSSPSLGVVT